MRKKKEKGNERCSTERVCRKGPKTGGKSVATTGRKSGGAIGQMNGRERGGGGSKLTPASGKERLQR